MAAFAISTQQAQISYNIKTFYLDTSMTKRKNLSWMCPGKTTNPLGHNWVSEYALNEWFVN